MRLFLAREVAVRSGDTTISKPLLALTNYGQSTYFDLIYCRRCELVPSSLQTLCYVKR